LTRLGAIIAGGLATRFGGDKGAALLDGVALVDHVVAALRSQVDEIVMVGRDWPGLTSMADRPAPGLGPLGGLCAALHHGRSIGAEDVLVVGCDTLPLPGDLGLRLAPGPAVVEGQWNIGLWPVSLADNLEAWLQQPRKYSWRAWMELTGARMVAFPEDFTNINSPDDLARLRP